ncbi:MAG: hypothetical protein RXR06_10540 [Thermoproteus sp.]
MRVIWLELADINTLRTPRSLFLHANTAISMFKHELKQTSEHADYIKARLDVGELASIAVEDRLAGDSAYVLRNSLLASSAGAGMEFLMQNIAADGAGNTVELMADGWGTLAVAYPNVGHVRYGRVLQVGVT